MEYFVLSQDESIRHTVMVDRTRIPEEWMPAGSIDRSIELSPEAIRKNQAYNFLVKSDKRNVYPDLIESPFLLTSTSLKAVFCSYEPKLPCRCAMLSDREQRVQNVYWIFALDRIECAGKGIEFYPNGFLKRLVLNQSKIGNRTIFRVQGIIEKRIIISADVADSILRRPMTGINMERVAVS